eukprot:1925588-Heterocapsa_arctica.AAC.1
MERARPEGNCCPTRVAGMMEGCRRSLEPQLAASSGRAIRWEIAKASERAGEAAARKSGRRSKRQEVARVQVKVGSCSPVPPSARALASFLACVARSWAQL